MGFSYLSYAKENKTGGITHLSLPPVNSLNDFIDEKLTSVNYSSFDNALQMVLKIGNCAEWKNGHKIGFQSVAYLSGRI